MAGYEPPSFSLGLDLGLDSEPQIASDNHPTKHRLPMTKISDLRSWIRILNPDLNRPGSSSASGEAPPPPRPPKRRRLVPLTMTLKISPQKTIFLKLNIVEGKMQYLFDENGRRYLDAFAGIVTVSSGHCHPEILNAIMEQSKLLQHATTIYLHHAIADFAEALASKLPGNLKVVYFVNSGSEANELAMMMARLYTGNLGMISLRNAYHGGSSGTLGLTALNTWVCLSNIASQNAGRIISF